MTRDQVRLRGLLRKRFQDDSPADELGDFLFRHGTPLDAFMYRNLFWPDFTEVDGMVFWSDADGANDPERIRAALHQYGDDRARTEKAFNLVEVPYLFGNPDPNGEIDDDLYIELARSLTEMWGARLRSLFPGRTFRFEIDDDANLLFYEERWV